MLKQLALVLILFTVTVGVFADDFVKTFNSFHRHFQLVKEQGNWTIKIDENWDDSGAYASTTINVLDIQNFYIEFTLNFPPRDSGPPGETYVFATYPKVGDTDIVAESRGNDFGLYYLTGGDIWQDADVGIFPAVYLRFFDAAYLAQHPNDLPTQPGYPGGIPNGPKVEGEDGNMALTYRLIIPEIGTTTLLTVEGTNSQDYPKKVYDLVAALRFHTIELSWDKKKGVFNIVRVH